MGNPTILLADDDQVLVALLSTTLEALGFDVMVAYDALQATMTLRRSTPQLIILDVNMPAGSGLEVLKRLRLVPKNHAIRVLTVSANTDPELPKTLKAMGADAFQQKPLDLETLHRTVCRLIGNARSAFPSLHAA
jgi:CheY-like chemotaxis protein